MFVHFDATGGELDAKSFEVHILDIGFSADGDENVITLDLRAFFGLEDIVIVIDFDDLADMGAEDEVGALAFHPFNDLAGVF